MKKYKIEIYLKTPTLLGSGEGVGSIIDTDIIFDDLGLPYFPGKRFKGLLRESAIEIVEMFKYSYKEFFSIDNVENLFGKVGDDKGAIIKFSDLYIPNYYQLREWLNWCYQEFDKVLSVERIINSFCEIRQHTSVDVNGVTKDKSLHTLRVLKANINFSGEIYSAELNEKEFMLLNLACLNLRHVGTKRNRGYGEIDCELWFGEDNLTANMKHKIKRGVFDVLH